MCWFSLVQKWDRIDEFSSDSAQEFIFITHHITTHTTIRDTIVLL